MVWTSPINRVPGEKIKAADHNTEVVDNLKALMLPPQVRVRRTTAQSIPNATNTAVIWSVEDYDRGEGGVGGAMWVPGTPTRLTVPVTGLYSCKFGGQFAINGSGARIMWVARNGTTIKGILHGVGSTIWYMGGTVVAEEVLAANDWWECFVYQSSGGALNLDVTYEIWAACHLISR